MMKRILSLLFSTLLFLSCSKEQQCSEAEISAPGVIRSITGPDTLTMGKTVAIIVEVATNDSFCSKRANVEIIASNGNYVQIGANLVYVAKGNKHCDCVHGPVVKTLVYFTPNKKGKYTFGTEEPDTNMGNAAPDTSDYQVFVP